VELLIRPPDLATLDVRVERRIARVTINNNPINLMDATLLGELDQLAGWLATQDDAVRVVIFQSGVPDFFLAHLDLGLIQAIVDDPEPDVALESFQGWWPATAGSIR
jgi:enoyl-CoA hydratase/carnithine racemase